MTFIFNRNVNRATFNSTEKYTNIWHCEAVVDDLLRKAKDF